MKSDIQSVQTLIIGGGISGLAAAKYLVDAGQSPLILEREAEVGGRIRTDSYQGYLLDRGFQIFLPSYEEAKKILDYEKLDLCSFERGARIWLNEAWETLPDPFDRPVAALLSAFSRVGNFRDKLGVAALQMKAQSGSLKGDPLLSTIDYLQRAGFSQVIIENFFRPFFEGVFLNRILSNPSSEFAYYFKNFAADGGAIPANGMQVIPMQLAEELPSDVIRTEQEVISVTKDLTVETNTQSYKAESIILAVEEQQLRKLFSFSRVDRNSEKRGTTALYFSGPRALKLPGYLHLVPNSPNGISNIVPLSSVAPEYAPFANTLICVSITHGEKNGHLLPDTVDVDSVKKELIALFGDPFSQLEHLRTYTISEALPTEKIDPESLELPNGVFLAGDISSQGSINGALLAGRLAAESILDK